VCVCLCVGVYVRVCCMWVYVCVCVYLSLFSCLLFREDRMFCFVLMLLCYVVVCFPSLTSLHSVCVCTLLQFVPLEVLDQYVYGT